MTEQADRFSAPRRRSLTALGRGLGRVSGEAEFRRIRDDSRRIEAGDAFLCLPRAADFAQDYAAAAERAGAVAVIAVGEAGRRIRTKLPCLRLETPEDAGRLLRRFFGTEKACTRLSGVTGTDGKTSVAWMLREALAHLGRKAWSIGTLGVIRQSETPEDLGNTTPSLLMLHALLAEANRLGVDDLILEVSSHGIEQHRIAGLDFQTAIWTSIGHDHLQDHGGREAYLALKAGFIAHASRQGATVVVNADHPAILDRAPEQALRYGHGLYRDDLTLAWEQELPGLLRLRCGGAEVRVEDVPLGDFHAENLACTALALLGGRLVTFDRLPETLAGITPPPGRLEDLHAGRWQVFVDYAHTPEALARVLESVRRITRGRLLLVFGCGGDRDREKRPRMGEIAARLADVVWITSDNPRSEPPEVIASEIEQGMPRPYPAEVRLLLDRKAAIEAAVGELDPGDSLVIAGKGHEPYMEIEGRRLPWSDPAVARAAIASRQLREERARCA
ncbi:MAG: UDP-N-acetylmuramoyl-L-alanyl-D-glutamate--2,6-diaminopimelate ligase [Mariprofundaceae bacterium]